MYQLPIAFVDIETTGMNPVNDRIVEVAIIRVEPDGTIQEYETLIDPDVSLSPELSAIHGITDQLLHEAPTFRSVAENIHEMLDGAIFAAHNARFDYGFLKQSFKRIQAPFNHPYIDTVKISRWLYPQYHRHGVDALISRLGLVVENRHRAMPDANVLYKFFQKILIDHQPEVLDDLIKRALTKPMLPANISHSMFENLPENCGIYIMYDQSNTPIYIGKSKNIRARVLQHFSNDMNSAKERKLSAHVRSINHIQTAGEIGALLLESQMIKKHLPIFNRMLRQSHTLTMLVLDTSLAYHRLQIDQVKNIHLYDPKQIMAICKSQRQAKQLIISTAQEYKLCQKILGVEKSQNSCFGYQIDKCKGACINKESPELHNLRLELAFTKTKIKSWPFENQKLITEKNLLTGQTDIFTINNWVIVKKTSHVQEEQISSVEFEQFFDYDTYKILLKAIL